MSTPSIESLTDSMKAGFDERPAGRLRDIHGKEAPGTFAVPLERDAYEVALDHIEPDPGQPRKTFDDEELSNLADSIRENGLLQPIVVYRPSASGPYRIIAGERRFRAAKLAGRSTVPCLEMPADFDPALVDQLQLVENIQRADLHPLEAAEAIEAFIGRHRLSQREAARRLGKPLSFVAELLAIRKIPDGLLSGRGVGRLPKQILVEIGRAPASEQPGLLHKALTGSPLDDIRDRRSNLEPRSRVIYFRERFLLDGQPPIEIRWQRHPEEVTDEDIVAALAAIARIVANRHSNRPFELRTPHGMA